MVIKSYSVTLESEVVEPAKKIMYSKSQKLSPVINKLLKEWLKKEDEDGNTE